MWLKISDNFHNHPKVVGAGNAAIGLWVRCGSYSSAYDLDGFIPRPVALAMSEHSTQQRALRRVGMWVPSNDGWMMHDFGDYNPLAVEWHEQRAKEAERKRAFRERARANGAAEQ